MASSIIPTVSLLSISLIFVFILDAKVGVMVDSPLTASLCCTLELFVFVCHDPHDFCSSRTYVAIRFLDVLDVMSPVSLHNDSVFCRPERECGSKKRFTYCHSNVV